MTLMLLETQTLGIAGAYTASDTRGRLKTGVAFVPCSLCRTPLDLAVLLEADAPQLCEGHRAPEYLPLH